MQPRFSSAISAASPVRSNAFASGRWQLWVDRGGGYDILQGERFSIGGPGGDDPADIAVRCRWSRHAATLIRWAHGDCIALCSEASDSAAAAWGRPLGPEEDLIIDSDGGQTPPRLRYRRPCPLSGSAVLTVMLPHRLCGPADASILFDQTLLLGPESFNHIQAPALSARGWVLQRRDDQWWIRGTEVPAQQVPVAQRWQYEDWSLMIREA